MINVNDHCKRFHPSRSKKKYNNKFNKSINLINLIK